MSALTCPNCAAPFGPEDVQLSLGLGACRSCRQVIRLDSLRPPDPARAALRQPAAWSRTIEGTTLVLRRSWRGPSTVFALPFAIFWCVLVGAFWVGLLTGKVQSAEMGAPIAVMLLPHTLIGVGLVYWALAGLLNTTTVRADAAALSVQHAPLPWFGSHSVARDRVQQLFVSRSSVRIGNKATFNLSYLDKDRVIHTLVGRGTHLDDPRWLEREIESHLNIENEQVPGEI